MSDLVNHLWQSTLFAGLVGVVAIALRSNRAAHRYWLWLAASMKFLVPFSLLVWLGSRLDLPQAGPVLPVTATSQIETSFAPIPPMVLPLGRSDSASWLGVLGGVWLIGFVVLLVRWFWRWHQLRAAVRACVPLAGPIPLYELPIAIEPGVFGVLRPVLLLPEGIAQRLSGEELDSIVAHELAHVRRRDNLTSSLHMVVEAMFWFHPLVWWIGARLIEERERACDEEVLRLGKRRRTYAQGILRFVSFTRSRLWFARRESLALI